MILKKIPGYLLLAMITTSCASDNASLDIDELKSLNELNNNEKKTISEFRNNAVDKLYVEGIGEIKIGTVLKHKRDGEGTVKALYLRNGIPWALFFLKGSSTGTINYLNKEYFYKLNN